MSCIEKAEPQGWDDDALLLLLHAGLQDLDLVPGERSQRTKQLLKQLQQSPFHHLLLREECQVIPVLARGQDKEIQRKLCQVRKLEDPLQVRKQISGNP